LGLIFMAVYTSRPGFSGLSRLVDRVERVFESRLYSDSVLVLRVLLNLDKFVSNFAKISILLLIAVFSIRGLVNGTLIPYSVTFIVNALRDLGGSELYLGIALLVLSGVLFAITEIALMAYFKKLARSIVALKEHIVNVVVDMRKSVRDSPEDLVGKIASDVDFVVWNINAVLTTLLPNLFTAVTALITLYSFEYTIGLVATATALPYLLYAEVYARRVDAYRTLERKTYAQSLVCIRDIVYGGGSSRDLRRVLADWEYSVNKILWLDRLYFTASFITALLSASAISLLAARRALEGRLSLGALSGVVYASITAHFAALNAMWALCIQGQTTIVLRRILSYLQVAGSRAETAQLTVVAR
jgi:ABC-type multidrug transport system fused ATPase/permease subunit